MPKKLLNENQTCLCMSVPNSDLNLSSGPAKDGDGRDVPFGGKDAEVVEKGCLASDPDQTRLRPNILLVLLGICSHLARAAQHLLSRLLTGSELSSGICSVLSGCPPRPLPTSGQGGQATKWRRTSRQWHPKIWTPLEAFLPFCQCRIEQRGVSSKKK